jgi:hypothetical protein
VTLRSLDLPLAFEPRSAMISAHLFDFGVCSLQVRIAAPTGLTWSAFADCCATIETSSELAMTVESELRDLLARIETGIDRPGLAPLSQEYKVFRIDRVERPTRSASGDGATAVVPIANAFSDEQLALLLIGEREHLSTTAHRELMPCRFSYYDADLTVLTAERALVVEPRSDNYDVEYILEFANAQFLELRMYDQLLDDALPSLYERAKAARARRSPLSAGRFRAVLSDLQTRVADITETVERVENALKVTTDVYLARIYGAALELFRERSWRRGIERKLAILRDTYAMLNSEAQAARAELLEATIVLLIVLELVLAILHGSAA